MLIEKRNAPEINDIVTIKLASGEEVIGRLSERTIDSVVLTKPVQIIFRPLSTQEMGLSFQPFLGSVGQQTSVQFVLANLSIRPVLTGDDVKRNYIQATSGVVPATELPQTR